MAILRADVLAFVPKRGLGANEDIDIKVRYLLRLHPFTYLVDIIPPLPLPLPAQSLLVLPSGASAYGILSFLRDPIWCWYLNSSLWSSILAFFSTWTPLGLPLTTLPSYHLHDVSLI